MPSSEIVAKIKKYMEQLNREDKIRHALSRLEKIDMTLDLLQKTQVGKAVNQLCRHEDYGDDALRIVTKWKEIARRNGILPVRQQSPSSSEHSDRSDQEMSPTHNRRLSPSPVREVKPKVEVKEECPSPPPSSSSSSYCYGQNDLKRKEPVKVKKEEDAFSRMLGTEGVPKVKKPKRMEWSDDIDLNYRPLPVIPNKTQHPKPVEEKFNPEQMFKPRNDRAKVFAGRKKTYTQVPRLYDLCLAVIGNNLNNLEECDGVPFYILQPVLEKCDVKRLTAIEAKNPHLEEDSDCLWEKFFIKSYPGRKKSKKETFKQAYFRMNRECDEKFKELSKRIATNQRVNSVNEHQTQCIDEAYAPLHIRRRQAKHGTSYGNRALPSAIEVSKARKEIFENGSTSSLQSIPSAVINRFSTVGSKKSSSSAPKPAQKKGALMVKTLKMLNMKRR